MNTTTTTTTARSQSIFTIVGVVAVAIAIAPGVWWGMHEAGLASSMPTNATAANGKISNNKISNDKAIDKGEVILNQPRYPRPPAVFDPVEALAVQASLAGGTTTKSLASSGSTASAPVAVQPVGWAGPGSVLQQMWDLGTQAEWAVRPAPLSPRNWRINGVVQRGEQTQAIVQFDGEPEPRFFKIGDTLPGGAKLAWVKPNVIGVVMPKAGALAVPVLDGQAPQKETK